MSTYITTHWAEPEPEIVAQQLFSLAQELEELQEPMMLAGEITRMDIQENFQTGTDPSGQAWEAWSQSYEPWALTHSSGPIFGDRANLQLTGELRSSIGSPSAFLPTNEGLFLDTSGLPEYWAWNNFGAYDRQSASRGEDVFGAISTNNPLPERPFVGISPEAAAKIDAAFAAWFNKEIAVAMSGRGTPFARHAKRGPGGRFVKAS